MRTMPMLLGAMALAVLLAPTIAAQDSSVPAAPSPVTPVNDGDQPGRAPAHGTSAPLQRFVSLELQDVSLDVALKEINRQAHLGLAYTPRVVPVDRRVTLHARHISAGEALRRVLRGTGVRPVVTGGGVVMLVKVHENNGTQTSDAASDTTQHGAVYGRVIDSVSNEPIAGAEVSVLGLAIQRTTNSQGRYSLIVPGGVHVISVRYLGYRTARREVAVVRDGQMVRLDFALQMGLARLQEVVTTATGKRRRLHVANDITVINVDSVMATAPISSVTDLLETRVPGLTVQHTSGAPGDPSRLRLRGASSVYENNDPIVIVDGVRVYGAQSDKRSANQASSDYAAPSPLDQIDPNSIASIEVVKGPSAATLYGADAANGVIVITTKRGRPGPAHLRVSASRGLSYVPGRYPESYLRFGHDYSGATTICGPLSGTGNSTLGCTAGVDSLVRFQALNDPDLTILGHGGVTRLSLGVDGGAAALTYSFTGSVDDETGIPKLPAYSVNRYVAQHSSPPPSWMRHPQSLRRWSGSGSVMAHLGRTADASITTTLTRETQQRSSLEQQLSELMSTYVDRSSGLYYHATQDGGYASSVALVPDFYSRVTDAATNFTTGAMLNWRPRTWLTGNANAGINLISRADDYLLPKDMLDTLGKVNTARGNSIVSTVNVGALATKTLPWGFQFRFATGMNYTKTSIGDLSTDVSDLAEGTTGINGAGTIVSSTESVSDIANFGWYVEPSFSQKLFSFSTGLRFDGGSTYGAHAALPAFPKLGGTWLVSGEPWFPFRSLFNTLHLRAAYGHAGVEPGITNRLRLFGSSIAYVDGSSVNGLQVSTLGNTHLKPERSTELEGGFDADLLNYRLSVSFTGYRKLRKDALLQVPVAPSVYGDKVTQWENIGVVRNTGVDAMVTLEAVRTDLVTWSASVGMSWRQSRVVSLAPGMPPLDLGGNIHVVAGYPLFGIWARPILGYADANGDGYLEANEVQLGDSAVYMGSGAPTYEASLHSTLSLFRGLVTVNCAFDYQDGLTQVNRTVFDNQLIQRAANDPTAPLAQQAAIAAVRQTAYGFIQTVSTLRFNSLSVAFNARPSLARRLGASAISVALQGTNLGLFTNYRGKDPNVNYFPTGNGIADTGVLPQPRSWLLVVSTRY